MRVPVLSDEPALPPLEHPASVVSTTLIPAELPEAAIVPRDPNNGLVLPGDGEDDCPQCHDGRRYPTHAKEGEEYWLCCFTYCSDAYECSDAPHIILDSEKCGDCEDHPCSCGRCSCGSRSLCSNCEDSCYGCCECWQCGSCGNLYSSSSSYCSCEECGYCTCCCSCGNPCGNCGERFDDGDGCGDCSNCNDCCKCEVRWPNRQEPLVIETRTINHGLWKSVDPVQAMADFYLLSYLEVTPSIPCALPEYQQALAAVADLAKQAKADVVEMLDKPFQVYVDMAIGGELRHHSSIRNKILKYQDRSTAWSQWFSVREQVGPQALLDAADLFHEMDGSYGGTPWATAAKILHQRVTNEIPAWLFVDRVFTMQHHNGSLLNKVTWASKHPIQGDVELCLWIGKAHDAIHTDFNMLQLVASQSTRRLFRQWWEARNRMMIVMDERPLPFPSLWDSVIPRLMSNSRYGTQNAKDDWQEILGCADVIKLMQNRPEPTPIVESDLELEKLLQEETMIEDLHQLQKAGMA